MNGKGANGLCDWSNDSSLVVGKFGTYQDCQREVLVGRCMRGKSRKGLGDNQVRPLP